MAPSQNLSGCAAETNLCLRAGPALSVRLFFIIFPIFLPDILPKFPVFQGSSTRHESSEQNF